MILDFSMSVSDLHFFWLIGIPWKGVMPKKWDFLNFFFLIWFVLVWNDFKLNFSQIGFFFVYFWRIFNFRILPKMLFDLFAFFP